MRHLERHRSEKIGWLRAAVLGADDGILPTASLVVGVAAAGSPRNQVLLARVAGLMPASAATFTLGAALPLLVVILAPQGHLSLIISGTSLVCLAALGAIAAHTGGASPWVGSRRVAFWGAVAMAATAGIGKLFGTNMA